MGQHDTSRRTVAASAVVTRSPIAAAVPTSKGTQPAGVGVPLVEVVRSGFRECVHHGSIIVLDPNGRPVSERGATREPIFPRSSNKPMQAVAMLLAGLDVVGADLAMIAASHRGEPMHVNRTRAILARYGLTEADLACPPDLPANPEARRALIAEGVEPAPIYMNCSGKHAGMLATCVCAGWPTAGYTDPDHPLQRLVRSTLEDLSGDQVAATGVDGCGAALFAISLGGLARAFATLVTAAPGTPERLVADAMRANPELVAGTGAEDTVLMSAVPGLLMKGGAEGVHAAALADGSAVALRITDGSSRGRMPVLTAGLRLLGVESAVLDSLAVGTVLGGGRQVGEVRLIAGAVAGAGREVAAE